MIIMMFCFVLIYASFTGFYIGITFYKTIWQYPENFEAIVLSHLSVPFKEYK